MSKNEDSHRTILSIVALVVVLGFVTVKYLMNPNIGKTQSTSLVPMVPKGVPPADLSQNSSRPSRDASRFLENAREYFPIEVGREWTYRIIVADSFSTRELRKPLSREIIVFPPSGNDGMSHSAIVRGMIGATVLRQDSFTLTLRIDRRAVDQGMAPYSNWHEITVVKDELGIFSEFAQVFYGSTSQYGYSVQQLGRQKDLRTAKSPRSIFIGQKGARIGLTGKEDSLYYVGEVLHSGRPAVLFRREAAVSNKSKNPLNPDWLDSAFVEEMIYVKGIGLASLVQTVRGIETMRWILEE